MQTIVLLLAILLAGPGLPTNAGDQGTRAPTAMQALPDNPCDVLTAAELAAATGLAVTSVRRVPTIQEGATAERQGRNPEPGTICRFETNSDVGAISIVVPRRSERRTARYWETRATYFETYPGSAQHIPGLGMDAWLAGGVGLSLLIRENEYLMLSTQKYQRRSRDVLVEVARAVAQR